MEIVGDGSKQYDEAIKALNRAMQEYDQAVFDLIASMVAGNALLLWYLI